MPRLSQWLARTALLYLFLGFTVGALLLAHKGVPFYAGMWRWLPAHMEFLFIGWTVQLTMGVAFWILPRFWQPPHRPQAHLAWPAYFLLNLGVWLVVAGTTLGGGRGWLLAGRLVESAAVLLFALSFWRRIVPRNAAGS